MFLGLSAVAGFLLRRPAGAPAMAGAPAVAVPVPNPPSQRRAAAQVSAPAVHTAPAATPVSHGSHNATLLAVLKEEMFDIESERLSGTLSPNEYKAQKDALETVLRRALKKQGS